MDHDFALDGDATLEAALQFISDCDFGHELEAVDSQSCVDENGVFTSNGTPSSSSEASDAQPANMPARGKKRRPVEELRELRKQEYELSAKVAALRLQARDKLSRQRLQEGVASVDECSGFWERVAARQREYRTRAEAENERLRTIVSAQIEKARRMRQTWLKRTQPTLETLGTFGAENAPSIPEDNDAVFAKLLDGIEEDCEVALQALASERQEPASKRVARSSKIQVNKEYRGDGDVLMEYFADASMPFSREAVASAAWQAFTRERSYRNPSFHRDLVDASDSEIKSSASLEIKLPMFGLFVRIRLVARRIVEEDHTVIVLKTFVEPKSLADRQGIGLVCYETFVRVISVGREATSARVETFATLRGKVLDGPNAEFWRRDFNVHVAKMVWSHAQASRAEILENILIEDAVIMPKE